MNHSTAAWKRHIPLTVPSVRLSQHWCILLIIAALVSLAFSCIECILRVGLSALCCPHNAFVCLNNVTVATFMFCDLKWIILSELFCLRFWNHNKSIFEWNSFSSPKENVEVDSCLRKGSFGCWSVSFWYNFILINYYARKIWHTISIT